MGFIEHFSDDTPSTILDNPNLYFPKDFLDSLKDKEIKHIKKYYVCLEAGEKTAKFKHMYDAKRWLSER